MSFIFNNRSQLITRVWQNGFPTHKPTHKSHFAKPRYVISKWRLTTQHFARHYFVVLNCQMYGYTTEVPPLDFDVSPITLPFFVANFCDIINSLPPQYNDAPVRHFA